MDLPPSPFRRRDLTERSLTSHAISELLLDGTIRQPFRGVYVDAGLPDTLELRAACLAIVVDEHHIVRDRTAAMLHGVDVHTPEEHEVLPPVECSARRGHTRTRRPGVSGGSRDLLDRDLVQVGGIWVTTPLRTALDLGCNLRRRDAYAALNEFARHHAVTADVLLREMRRFRGRRGVRQLRALIPLVEPLVESPRESWVYLEMLDAGLPAPQPQVWVERGGVPAYRLDFAYLRHRICIEYDGADAHSDPAQQAHDEARRSWLRENGWVVIVVRVGDFTGVRRDRWLAEVGQALQDRYSNRRW